MRTLFSMLKHGSNWANPLGVGVFGSGFESGVDERVFRFSFIIVEYMDKREKEDVFVEVIKKF